MELTCGNGGAVGELLSVGQCEGDGERAFVGGGAGGKREGEEVGAGDGVPVFVVGGGIVEVHGPGGELWAMAYGGGGEEFEGTGPGGFCDVVELVGEFQAGLEGGRFFAGGGHEA